ncbi:MAG: hypothetical protein A2Y16_04575 [Tenericutes bacterium GWF2_57_13]|nr:MAG: hypothetical protein A2Y16_04575 [Tenericutes bacterium GWF2_57_13]
MLGKVRIEYFAIGLFILTMIVYSSRLYVCRLDGAVIASLTWNDLPTFFGSLSRVIILDACFATVGFMVFENGYSKHAKLAFKLGFGVAALLFVLNLTLVLVYASNDPLNASGLYFGRMELGVDSLLVGGLGFGFFLYIVLLLAYGVAVFLHPGYSGADEPTLYRYVLRLLKKPDPLPRMDVAGNPELVKNIPLAVFYTIITFGVYYYFWMFHLIKAMHKVTNDASAPTKDFLLSILVLPGLQIMFALNLKKWEEYLFAHRDALQIRKSDYSLPYLLLTIFGLGFIAVLMMQLDLNKTGSIRTEATVNAEAKA